MTLLSDDVTMWADGGGKTRGAATQPLHGRTAVTRFVLASTRFLPANSHVRIAEVNGQPAVIVRVGDHAAFVLTIEGDGNHICEIRVIGNPEKPRWV